MTSDEFNSKYRLLKQISGKGGRSYTAEHRASGRAVLVHILEESQVGGLAGLDALLQRLPPRDQPRVLDRMAVDRSLAVVTQFLQGFDSFESWLRDRTSAPPSRPLTAADLPPEHQGEFTRLFRSSEEAPPPPSERPGTGPERAPAPAAPEGSKFTDLFRAGAEPPPRAQGPPPDRATMPPAPEGSQFTDLFRAGAEPPPQTPGPPDRATIPPLRMVGLRMALPPEPDSPAPELPRLRPNFGGSPEPDMQAETPRPGDIVIRNPEPFDEAPPPPSWEGPSEFTRQLGSLPPPTGGLEAVPRSAPQEDSPDEKRSYLPLILVLNLVFILGTGVIVYFLLKRC
jgi:hypothetical protein